MSYCPEHAGNVINETALQQRNSRISRQQQHSYNGIVEVHHRPTDEPSEDAAAADEEDTEDEPNESIQPILRRQDQEPPRTKKMERGISRATENEILISRARGKVEHDFSVSFNSSRPDSKSPLAAGSHPDSPTSKNATRFLMDCIETPVYTFTLPDITRYPEHFRNFLKKDLIEVSSQSQLEQSGRLNWWTETGTCQRLWPIATTGDGNCLLHAASLAMWGFHDRLLTLRKALHTLLTNGDIWPAIYRRWRLQSHLYNTQFGLVLSEAEWQDEWKSVLKLASSEPRHPSTTSSNSSSSSTGGEPPSSSTTTTSQRRRSRLSIVVPNIKDLDSQGESTSSSSSSTGSTSSASMLYESLEEVHVLTLAHVLRRPIIVVADTILRDMNGEALAPIPFGGIYLPLETPAEECHKSPLLLTYNAGHFSALVTMQDHSQPECYDTQLPAVIPVTDADHALLNVHFSVDPGPDFVWGQDEYDPEIMSRLIQLGEPAEHLGILTVFLELVRVPLPEWLLDPAYQDQVDHHHHHQAKRKPIQSVAKQFGSLGKVFKRNLSKITKTVGGRSGKDAVDHHNQPIRPRIVSGSQAFILGAVIHNRECLPYQHEMIDNYLVDARERFDLDNALKAKQKLEQIEQNDKLKREIYLNGGYVDCVNPGCVDQGTAETSYLCKSCFHEQTVARNKASYQQQQQQQQKSKSTFYVVPAPPEVLAPPVAAPVVALATSRSPVPSSMEVGNCSSLTAPAVSKKPTTVGHIVPVEVYPTMRVKLPIQKTSQPCKNLSCEFYGTPELDYFCSKCSKSAQVVSR